MTRTTARLGARPLAAAAVRGEPAPDHLWTLGKAAFAAAEGIVAELGAPRHGLVVTKHGHGGVLAGVQVMEGGHPLPDAASARAGDALLAAAARVRPGERVLLVVTGGASAVCVAPAGVTLADKIAATRALLGAGAEIGAINAVRKHLSAWKGGRLALATRGTIRALLLSDVLGDDPATIGSGPVSPDPTTYADALAVSAPLPDAVRALLERGARGELPETPKTALAHVSVELLAGPETLLAVARAELARLGWDAEAQLWRGSAADLAQAIARAERPSIWVGEPTVVLPPSPGRGGRAQQVALLAAEHLGGRTLLAAGSDGTDGPTADAGAIVDGTTWDRVRAAGIDPADACARCDAGTALAAAGDLVTTGPTGTNLCDLYVVVTGGPTRSPA